jgi:hypothetical protein
MTMETRHIYQDSRAPINARVRDLSARMTLAEKIGQMIQVENLSITPPEVTHCLIGSVLSGGGGNPEPNTPERWAAMVQGHQQAALEPRLGIPLLYGADAVHGHGNVRGAVIYDPAGSLEAADALGAEAVAVVGIVVLSEEPYAEGEGDREDLHLPDADVPLLKRVRARCRKLIVLIISGRPLVVTEHLPEWDACIAAWLPGTEGGGIAQALFGDYPFVGKLPYTLPRSMDQVPRKQGDEGLFPLGYGLS